MLEVIYIYDGSMDGLLSCIFEAFSKKENPISISKTDCIQLALGANVREISTDLTNAERVYNGIRQKLGTKALDAVFYATLSSEDDAESTALAFLRLAFKSGPRVFDNLSDSRVWRMFEIVRTVEKDKGRYLEFLRFSELEGGILFAEFEPEPNVLPLIMPHFSDRLNALPFIIHDKNRLIAGIYDTKEWLIVSSANMKLPEFSAHENEYRQLWKLFYNTISIKERVNEKLQMQLMPKKYWRYMTEMQL